MKVLYQTVPSFFDLEISLIRELTKQVDLKVLMIVSPASMHSSAFSIDSIDSRCDIIPASEYIGMEKYNKMINLSDWYIANNPDNSIIHAISLAAKIRKFYKKGGFTFFHSTTDCKTALMNLPFYATLKNKLYTTHDPISHRKLSFLSDFFRYRMMFNSFKNLLFLSDSLVEPFCKKYAYPRERIYFSRLSVYDFLLSYDIGTNPYGNYILFFGRIDEYKGVDVLIDAYQNSEASRFGVKLVIAGRGNLEHDTSKLPKSIILINKYIANEELANLILNSKFIVLPYRSATQSGCVMSAFAFKKPVLATKVGDLPHEIINNVTGLLAEPNNVIDLSKKINEMLRADIMLYEKNIENRFAPESIYSWTAIAKSLINIYRNLENQS